MIWIVGLFFFSVFLSAFFSGTETGFYRVTRIRLVLDALDGRFLAKFLLFLTNHPALFVATTLIGNNLANYLVSLSIVLAAGALFPGNSTAELLLPTLLAPALFVYGESLPKNLFFHAPNKLLLRGSPLFFLVTILFAPFSAVLWVLGQALQWLLGESPTQVRLQLARKELEDVLEEGGEAGLLNAGQRRLAQGLFAVANQSVGALATPLSRTHVATLGADKSAALAYAKKNKVSSLPVANKGEKSDIVGYLRTCDLILAPEKTIQSYRVLPVVAGSDTQIAALLRMQSSGESMAIVKARDGKTLGIVTLDQLMRPILYSES
ncbi:CNNM domain-containing protein [Blastopirellula sp. JC732]|uniref:CNNM domain-containing protein n=1 Tax=Blastopirellula sediminis TaxID=2894196 RepID=A0A9X1MP87_9BACT|nr:CNNM domain-containing protein [Blastopirellula sediminis]MCC9605898.1 CNNM domain-containing protein [Blastopirellula sediminis]MCC9630803.1 CNNM domain-containing protein [Blastopirellula sediminis]